MKAVLYTDGASRGNPGDASIGAYICTEDGISLCEISEYIGKTTNNVAEYMALIRGLKECLALDLLDVSVYMDSQLIVKQCVGEYKVKTPHIRPLYNEVKTLEQAFRTFSITHIKRALNGKADALANEAFKKIKQVG